MLDVNYTMDHLAMADSVHWYGHVLWREDGMSLEGHWTLRLKVNGRKTDKDTEAAG